MRTNISWVDGDPSANLLVKRWQKYDETVFNGGDMHFYRKPKRFGSLKKLDDKS